MKITELLEQRQQVDELNMAQVGNAIGKGATAVGKGIGATASGAVQTGKNLWQGLKQGWKAGQAAVAGDPAAPAPTAGPAAGQGATPAPAAAGAAQPSGAPAVQATPQPTQAGPTAGQGATPAPAAAGQGGSGGGAATSSPIASLKAQIDKLDPASKKELVGLLQKPAAEPTAAPAPGGTTPPADPNATPTPGAPTPANLGQDHGLGKQSNGEFITPGQKFDTETGKPLEAPATEPAAPTTPPAGGKMTAAQQAALKAKLQGQRQAGKTTASQTGSGFSDYVKGGGGSTMAGADAQGNPIFKQNVARESVEFHSKFLGIII